MRPATLVGGLGLSVLCAVGCDGSPAQHTVGVAEKIRAGEAAHATEETTTLETRLRGMALPEGPLSTAERHAAMRTLDALEARVRSRLEASNPADLLTELSESLFADLEFQREIDDPHPRFTLLGPVLAMRRGNCVGLASVLLVVAERLKLPVAGAVAPGHFYLLVSELGFGTRNLELLRRGESLTDDWYDARYPFPRPSATYARPLSDVEVEGVVHYNLGAYFRRTEQLMAARSAYQRATAKFPQLAEAHAGLGATEQLLGSVGSARTSYERALRHNPGLTGLERNLEALRAHVAVRAASQSAL